MGAGHAQIAGSQSDLASRFVTNPSVILDAEDRRTLSHVANNEHVVSAEWNGAVHVRLTHLDHLPDLSPISSPAAFGSPGYNRTTRLSKRSTSRCSVH